MEDGWFLRDIVDSFNVGGCISPKRSDVIGGELLRAPERNLENHEGLRTDLLNLRGHSMEHYYHSLRVGYIFLDFLENMYGGAIGSLSKDTLSVVGFVHDVGKFRIPLKVLNKVGKLDDGEKNIILEHNPKGYSMLKKHEEDFPELAGIQILHHPYNGKESDLNAFISRHIDKGSPKKLVSDLQELRKPRMKINVRVANSPSDVKRAGAILQVCDGFEAICSERTYRAAMNFESATKTLRLAFPNQQNLIKYLFDNYVPPEES